MDMFDIIVLAVIGILTVLGLLNGMVKQFFGLAGVVAGYMLAMRYYQPCSKYLTSLHPGTAKVISFIAIFLPALLLPTSLDGSSENLLPLLDWGS
jgi:uncharacterized membrane protein required for colicin V production